MCSTILKRKRKCQKEKIKLEYYIHFLIKIKMKIQINKQRNYRQSKNILLIWMNHFLIFLNIPLNMMYVIDVKANWFRSITKVFLICKKCVIDFLI